MALMPSRIILWSSTRSTLKGMWRLTGVFRNLSRSRKTGPDHCAPIRGRLHCECRMPLLSVIVHQQFPPGQCARIRFIKLAIVMHLHNELTRQPFQLDFDQRASGPRQSIIHGAFGNLVESGSERSWDVSGGIELQAQGTVKTLSDFAGHTLHGELQSRSLDNRRIQLITDVAQLFDSLLEHALNLGGSFIDAGRLLAEIHSHSIKL